MERLPADILFEIFIRITEPFEFVLCKQLFNVNLIARLKKARVAKADKLLTNYDPSPDMTEEDMIALMIAYEDLPALKIWYFGRDKSVNNFLAFQIGCSDDLRILRWGRYIGLNLNYINMAGSAILHNQLYILDWIHSLGVDLDWKWLVNRVDRSRVDIIDRYS